MIQPPQIHPLNSRSRDRDSDLRPRLFRSRRHFVIAIVCALVSGLACGERNNRNESSPSMFVSGPEFNRGRNDGRRDAKWSLTDKNASWLWTWMADQQYRQGYKVGWTEGRAEVKFNEEQKRAKHDTKSEDSGPPASGGL
ncbi:MAG: hypothetical protein KF841_06580 [Phycisphaerae bacterium]|nr:hypothetical protein [Phycisphaerae bacterium]